MKKVLKELNKTAENQRKTLKNLNAIFERVFWNEGRVAPLYRDAPKWSEVQNYFFQKNFLFSTNIGV